MKRLVLFLVLVIFQSEAIVNHNPVKPGCPPVVTPKENLLLERFSGVWYEIQKYSNQFELGTCISINIGFVRELNASTVSIRHNQKVGDNFTDFDQTAQVKSLNSVWSFKNNSSLIGDITIFTLQESYSFYTFFAADVDGFIYILDTNYVNYAVIFACGIINKKQNGQMV